MHSDSLTQDTDGHVKERAQKILQKAIQRTQSPDDCYDTPVNPMLDDNSEESFKL